MTPIPKRLLFVDDERAIRETLSTILQRYGFVVRLAATTSEAFEEIQKHEFDVLLCDLNIDREGDGYNVIRAMRKVNPNCVTVILTGYPDVRSAVEGIHEGIDDYIVKPAKADELVALLADRLAARLRKGKVLTISYDEPVQNTWRLLLESRGYDVVSPIGLEASLKACKEEEPDVFVLGRSVPAADRAKLVSAFRASSNSPIISVTNNTDEAADGADFHVVPDPEAVLRVIADLRSKFRSAKHQA